MGGFQVAEVEGPPLRSLNLPVGDGTLLPYVLLRNRVFLDCWPILLFSAMAGSPSSPGPSNPAASLRPELPCCPAGTMWGLLSHLPLWAPFLTFTSNHSSPGPLPYTRGECSPVLAFLLFSSSLGECAFRHCFIVILGGGSQEGQHTCVASSLSLNRNLQFPLFPFLLIYFFKVNSYPQCGA